MTARPHPIRFAASRLLGPRQQARLSTELSAPAWEVACRGTILRGTIRRTNLGRPWLLHFYGAVSMSEQFETGRLDWLHRSLDLNVACLDYRGYGRSDGRFDLGTVLDDAEIALGDLLHLNGGQPIHLHGFSLGASVASHLAARRPCASLILLAPVARLLPRWFPTGVVDRLDGGTNRLLSVLAAIRCVEAPLLVFHGSADRLVPPAHGSAVTQASPARVKQLVRVEGASHSTLPFSGGLYETHLRTWFAHKTTLAD